MHGNNLVVGDAHGLGDNLCGDAEVEEVASGFLLGFDLTFYFSLGFSFGETDLFSFNLSFRETDLFAFDFGFFFEIFNFLSVYEFDGTGNVGILVLFHVVGDDVDDISLFFCFCGELYIQKKHKGLGLCVFGEVGYLLQSIN